MKSKRGKWQRPGLQTCTYFILSFCLISNGTGQVFGQGRAGVGMGGLPSWMSLSANLEAAYRSTNLFKSNQDTTILQGDARLEVWLPPGIDRFSWGPYVRIAGLDSNRSEAWENAWMAGPGFGLHMFPFSDKSLREQAGFLGPMLGPLRLFGEHNRLNYVGAANQWRPDEQIRAGADYWRAHHVNDTRTPCWTELWSGLFWQSANEFDAHYDSVIFGNSFRVGVRKPDAGLLSLFSIYGVLESSLTENAAYYWENRLLGGLGIRLAPMLRRGGSKTDWLSRLVVFAEYLEVLDYYRADAPSGIPDHDFRAGIGLTIGKWYR